MQTKLQVKDTLTRHPADRKLMRDLNQNIIFNLIREHEPLSRPHLAALSGLSLATVITLTNELIEHEFVTENGSAESTGGRKASLFEIRLDSRFAIGLMLRAFETIAVIVNLRGEVIFSERWNITIRHDHLKALDMLAENILQFVGRAGIPKEHIIGAGCAISGYIDARAGRCVDSWKLDWHHVDVSEPLSERTGIPIYIDNDISCITSYEKLFGKGSNFQDFLTITIGSGIGLGTVINGEVYRGASGGAGEFGHIVAITGGRMCECGKRGCLEEYSSYRGIISTYREQIGDDNANINLVGETTEQILQFAEITIQELIGQAEQDDTMANRAFQRSAKILGISVANLVNLLNPEAIILTGEGTIMGDRFFEPLITTLRQNTFSELGNPAHLEIIIEPVSGYTSWAQGAGALVLRHFFALPVRS